MTLHVVIFSIIFHHSPYIFHEIKFGLNFFNGCSWCKSAKPNPFFTDNKKKNSSTKPRTFTLLYIQLIEARYGCICIWYSPQKMFCAWRTDTHPKDRNTIFLQLIKIYSIWHDEYTCRAIVGLFAFWNEYKNDCSEWMNQENIFIIIMSNPFSGLAFISIHP